MNLAETIEICCLMEATARKPGNVHPAASFVDLNYDDFVQGASAVAGPLADTPSTGLGQAIFNAVQATRRGARSNVNLGIALLIAPLAAVPATSPLDAGVREILSRTTLEDAEQVYAAIRIAKPGGMGSASSQDIHDRPTITLREAMALAADRDRIAEQYATDFSDVLNRVRPWLVDAWCWSETIANEIPRLEDIPQLSGIVPWELAILRLQIRLLADAPDSLVARKCGPVIAAELQQRAIAINDADWSINHAALQQFDGWLRADGHRRNPGTTADIIAATLFAAVRDGLIEPPSRDDIRQQAARIRQTHAGKMDS